MEAADLELIAAVRASVTIPLAVKLSPYYSAFANFAAAATDAGADGLVLFNRFYQPDLDLDSLDVVPSLELSRPWEMRLPVRWIAILRPQLGPGVSLAASSGAHTGTDVVKGLMVGADVVMMTSALLRHGPQHVAAVEAELRAWMTEHEYESVEQLRASASQATVADPSAFERAQLHADPSIVGHARRDNRRLGPSYRHRPRRARRPDDRPAGTWNGEGSESPPHSWLEFPGRGPAPVGLRRARSPAAEPGP